MTDIDVRNGGQIDLIIGRSADPINLEIEKQSGASDYNMLTGKPKINGVTVQGEKLGPDYRLQNKMDTLTIQEVEKIFYIGD